MGATGIEPVTSAVSRRFRGVAVHGILLANPYATRVFPTHRCSSIRVVSHQNASYARPGAGPYLEVSLGACVSRSRYEPAVPIFFDYTSSANMAGSAGALVSSALSEVETIAAPEDITPAIQAAIDTLDR